MRFAVLLCRVFGHVPPTRPVCNDRHAFGACPRCRADLCRAEEGEWEAVPRGFRVVWRTPAAPPRPLTASAVVWDGSGRGATAAMRE